MRQKTEREQFPGVEVDGCDQAVLVAGHIEDDDVIATLHFHEIGLRVCPAKLGEIHPLGGSRVFEKRVDPVRRLRKINSHSLEESLLDDPHWTQYVSNRGGWSTVYSLEKSACHPYRCGYSPP